jgi:hypothetical protein
MVSGILGSMVEMVGNIVTTLWEGIKSVFSSLGTYIYDQIKDTLGFFGSFFGGDDTEETKVNDAVIGPSGDVISTSPEDYLIATKNPAGLADATSGNMVGNMGGGMDMIPEDYLMATKNPAGLADATSGNIVGNMVGNMGGGMDMSSVINELKELKSAFLSNKDVYVSGKKVTDNVTRLQEKSNINQFGLMGA